MAVISSANLNRLRDNANPDYSDVRVYPFGHELVWQGRVHEPNGIARGAQVITYDSGSLESGFNFADIRPGMLVVFGEGPGEARDEIKSRLLLAISGSASTGTITVDWHDDIQLLNNMRIKIMHHYPPWPKYSWFQVDPTDFRKSGPPSPAGVGIDFSDQTDTPPPLVVMGRHAVKRVTGEESHWWTSSTVLEADVVAAYQFRHAGSATLAKTNLANPGAFTLAAAPTYGEPTWSSANGFEFDGVNDVLDTGIVLGENYTVIVMWKLEADGDANAEELFGTDEVGGNFFIAFDQQAVGPGVDGLRLQNIQYGATSATPNAVDDNDELVAHTVSVNGDRIRMLESVFENWSTSGWSNLTGNAWLGAVNGLEANLWESDVYALAIYNRRLTNAEMQTIENQMLNISGQPTELAIQCNAASSQAVGPGASISTYAWSATPSGVYGVFSDTGVASPTFYPDLSQSRRYVLHCTVTDSNGKSATGHRALVVDLDSDDSLRFDEFSLSSITERMGDTSVPATFSLTDPLLTLHAKVPADSLVIIASDDYYSAETTTNPISFRDAGRYTDRQNIVYCGYVAGVESGRIEPSGLVTHEIRLVGVVDMFLYSLSLTGVDDATDWIEMNRNLMYVAALVHHLVYWHSTLMEVGDWLLDWSDTTKRSAMEEWTEGDFMDRLKASVGPHGRLMVVTATAQGEVFVEHDLNLLDKTTRDATTTIMTLTNPDIATQRQIKFQHRPRISEVLADGGSSTGVLGSFVPYLSISQLVRRAVGPGTVHLRRLMLQSQTEANRITGRVLAVENRYFFEVVLDFKGNYREVFSPADQEWLNVGQIFDENNRDFNDLQNRRVVVRQVIRSFDNEQGIWTVSIVADFEAEPEGELTGRTITLPGVEPVYVPPVVNPGGGDTPPSPLNVLITIDDTNGVEVYFQGIGWETRNTGLSGAELQGNSLKVVPFWWLLQGSSDPEDAVVWIATEGGLFMTDDLGTTWDERTPLEDLENTPDPAVTGETLSYIAVDTPALNTSINNTLVAQGIEEFASVWYTWNFISTDSGRDWTNDESEDSTDEIKGLDLVIDQGVGSNIYEARHNLTDNKLQVRRLNTALAQQAAADFASATEGEVTARTYKLKLYVPKDPSVASSQNVVFAYGRMQKA